MKRIKRKTYLFIISFMITACIISGFLGICIAYENIVRVAYGQYKTAVSLDGGNIRILDFEFEIVK